MTSALAPTGPTDDDISRALDRLAKARVALRDVGRRIPAPSRSRIEAVERAHRAVEQAAAVRARRPDDPAADKTHSLAEIAEILALRREGFWSWTDYEATVVPGAIDPRTREPLQRAEVEFAAAQAQWDVVKLGLVDPAEVSADDTVIDLTGDTPIVRSSEA